MPSQSILERNTVMTVEHSKGVSLQGYLLYWIDLTTSIKASRARPLIDSLKHEATAKDDTIREIIPLQLKSFEEAIKAAKE